MITQVPFVDLVSQEQPLHAELMSGIEKVLKKCNFILGEEVSDFERNFAEFVHSKYHVGMANGTDALSLAVRACGVGPGDEVIVPVNTFIASALGIVMAGAKPVFVDMDEKTFLIDCNKIEEKITPKTKAIMPVHLYGRMVDMAPLMKIAKKYNLKVIEDTAQAHGAHIGDQWAGSVGDAGCFSFYPGKNLGVYGDGGGVSTNNSELYQKLLALRNYGSPIKYHHPMIGFNSRLDTIQAVILNIKLKHLGVWGEKRYSHAQSYNTLLKNVSDIKLPEIPITGSHVFHLYVIRTTKREALSEYLKAKNISTVIHYPIPLHLQGAFADLKYKEGDFPIAEKVSKEILSLPMFPELTTSQIEHVADSLKEFFQSR